MLCCPCGLDSSEPYPVVLRCLHECIQSYPVPQIKFRLFSSALTPILSPSPCVLFKRKHGSNEFHISRALKNLKWQLLLHPGEKDKTDYMVVHCISALKIACTSQTFWLLCFSNDFIHLESFLIKMPYLLFVRQ